MSTLLLDACAGCAQIISSGNIANATNGQDVEIANTICCSIVTLTGILVGGFLIWKLMDYIAKGVAAYYMRKCEVEDIFRKQQADEKDSIEKKPQLTLEQKEKNRFLEFCYEMAKSTEMDNLDMKKECWDILKERVNISPKSQKSNGN